MGNGSEIFLLDMGDPVKIIRLAEEMIRLSGRRPYEDIEITFTGLRPGEKLYEELLIDGEGIKPTRHEKIRVLEATNTTCGYVEEETDQLLEATRSGNPEILINILKQIVPEFRSSYSAASPLFKTAARIEKSINLVG
jgi:FlaA1/EpsC-like NDP-sugar epimerase